MIGQPYHPSTAVAFLPVSVGSNAGGDEGEGAPVGTGVAFASGHPVMHRCFQVISPGSVACGWPDVREGDNLVPGAFHHERGCAVDQLFEQVRLPGPELDLQRGVVSLVTSS